MNDALAHIFYWASIPVDVDRLAYPAGVLDALTPRERIGHVTEKDRY